jgi:hypothetical protein
VNQHASEKVIIDQIVLNYTKVVTSQEVVTSPHMSTLKVLLNKLCKAYANGSRSSVGMVRPVYLP